MDNNQRKEAVRAVLTAALHNAKMVQDQLESLTNPEDKSFDDFPMDDAIQQTSEAVQSIQKALEGL